MKFIEKYFGNRTVPASIFPSERLIERRIDRCRLQQLEPVAGTEPFEMETTLETVPFDAADARTGISGHRLQAVSSQEHASFPVSGTDRQGLGGKALVVTIIPHSCPLGHGNEAIDLGPFVDYSA